MAGTGSMTQDEREAFLAELHVAVIAVDEPGRGPLAMPIWYLYQDRQVLLSMATDSVKAQLLRAAGRATLTVQSETAPYQYVCVEGPVTIEPKFHDALELATRYLGPEFGQWYVDANPDTGETVTVVLRPEHWRTHDYHKTLG